MPTTSRWAGTDVDERGLRHCADTPILAHPLQGQSPYSATKIGADKLVESYARSFEMDAVRVLRPFNTFGPRQSFRAVIPTIIGQLLAGDGVTLGNLTAAATLPTSATRVAHSSSRPSDVAPGTVCTSAPSGGVTSVTSSTAGKLVGQVGRHHDAQRVRPEDSEVEVLLSDPKCAEESLGWKPEVDFAAGLAATAAWLREHGDLARADEYGW